MTQKSHYQAYTLRKPQFKQYTCIPMFIAALFRITRTWKQPRCLSTDEWIKKMLYIYIMDYYSPIKRNEFESVLVRWMNLVPVIQSEVSQKEKSKYCMLRHTYGIPQIFNLPLAFPKVSLVRGLESSSESNKFRNCFLGSVWLAKPFSSMSFNPMDFTGLRKSDGQKASLYLQSESIPNYFYFLFYNVYFYLLIG